MANEIIRVTRFSSSLSGTVASVVERMPLRTAMSFERRLLPDIAPLTASRADTAFSGYPGKRERIFLFLNHK